jgi:hypothetical protein
MMDWSNSNSMAKDSAVISTIAKRAPAVKLVHALL